MVPELGAFALILALLLAGLQGTLPIAGAHRRLDDIAALAAHPQVRLPPRHRWLAEARMLRGDAYAAQGKLDAAIREWQAAEAVFAARYGADHPFRRHLAARLQPSVASR